MPCLARQILNHWTTRDVPDPWVSKRQSDWVRDRQSIDVESRILKGLCFALYLGEAVLRLE